MELHEFEYYLLNSPLNGTRFSSDETLQITNSVQEQITTESGSCFNLVDRLNKSEAKRQNITVEQYVFNTVAQKAVDRRSASNFQSKWADFIQNRKDLAENNLKTANLVSLILSNLDASTYIKPTKTNLSKILKWSSSRYADYRKSEIVSIILSSSLSPSKSSKVREFSSGSTTTSGGLGGRASYRLVEALGVTILIDDLEGKIYRFEEEYGDVLEHLNNFEKDKDLLDELESYQDELSTLGLTPTGELPF